MLSLIHSNIVFAVHKNDWLLVPAIIICALVVYCILRASKNVSKETLRTAGWMLVIQAALFVALTIYELTR
jgi:hypothetical protein